MDSRVPDIVSQIQGGQAKASYWRGEWEEQLRNPEERRKLEQWLADNPTVLSGNVAYTESCREIIKAFIANAGPEEDQHIAQIGALFRASVPGFNDSDLSSLRAYARHHGLNQTSAIFDQLSGVQLQEARVHGILTAYFNNSKDPILSHALDELVSDSDLLPHVVSILPQLAPGKLPEHIQRRLADCAAETTEESLWATDYAPPPADSLILWMNRGRNEVFFQELAKYMSTDDLAAALAVTDAANDSVLRHVMIGPDSPLLQLLTSSKDAHRFLMDPVALIDLVAARVGNPGAGEAFLAEVKQGRVLPEEDSLALLRCCQQTPVSPDELIACLEDDTALELFLRSPCVGARLADDTDWQGRSALMARAYQIGGVELLIEAFPPDAVCSHLVGLEDRVATKVLKELSDADVIRLVEQYPALLERLIDNNLLYALEEVAKKTKPELLVRVLDRLDSTGATVLIRVAKNAKAQPSLLNLLLGRMAEPRAEVLRRHDNQGLSLLDHCIRRRLLPEVFRSRNPDLLRPYFGPQGLDAAFIARYVSSWAEYPAYVNSPVDLFPAEVLLPHLQQFCAEDILTIYLSVRKGGMTREAWLERLQTPDAAGQTLLSSRYQLPRPGMSKESPTELANALKQTVTDEQWHSLMTTPVMGVTVVALQLPWRAGDIVPIIDYWARVLGSARLGALLAVNDPQGRSYLDLAASYLANVKPITDESRRCMLIFLTEIVPQEKRRDLIVSMTVEKKGCEWLLNSLKGLPLADQERVILSCFGDCTRQELVKILGAAPRLFATLAAVPRAALALMRQLGDRDLLAAALKTRMSDNQETVLHQMCRSGVDVTLLDPLEPKVREELLCLPNKDGWTPWMLLLRSSESREQIQRVVELLPTPARLGALKQRACWLEAVCGIDLSKVRPAVEEPAAGDDAGAGAAALLAGVAVGAALGGGLGVVAGAAAEQDRPRRRRGGDGAGLGLWGLALGALAGGAIALFAAGGPAQRRARRGNAGGDPDVVFLTPSTYSNMSDAGRVRVPCVLQGLNSAQIAELLAVHPHMVSGMLRAGARDAVELLVKRAPPTALVENLGSPDRLNEVDRAAAEAIVLSEGGEELQGYWLEPLIPINPAHMRVRIAEADLGPAPQNARILDIAEAFNRINFTDETKPGYVNPKRLMNDNGPTTVDDLRGHLLNMLGHAENRKPGHYGVPNEETHRADFKKYYDTLRNLLGHISNDVRLLTDRAEELVRKAAATASDEERSAFSREADDLMQRVAGCLIDLAVGAEVCGTRWMGEANDVCLRLHEGGTAVVVEKLRFDQQLLARLSKLRFGIIQEIVAQRHEGNVHSYNRYMALLGEELGISGAGGSYEADPYANRRLTAADARAEFSRRYTAPRILDAVDQAVHSDLALRELAHGWLVDHMEQDWESARWNPILGAARGDNPVEALRALGIEYVPGDPESVLARTRQRLEAADIPAFEQEMDAAQAQGMLAVVRAANKYGIQARTADAAKAIIKERQAQLLAWEQQVRDIRNSGKSLAEQRVEIAKLNIGGYHLETDLAPSEFVTQLRRSEYGESLYYPVGSARQGQLRRHCIRQLLASLQVLVLEREGRPTKPATE